MTAFFFDNFITFKEMMYQQRSAEKVMKRRKRKVKQAKKRIAELDSIFKRIYEDGMSNAISHDRFLRLSTEYKAKQWESEKKIKSEQQEANAYKRNKSDFYSFSAEIIIHAPEKVNGIWILKVDIIFNFTGKSISAIQPKQ